MLRRSGSAALLTWYATLLIEGSRGCGCIGASGRARFPPKRFGFAEKAESPWSTGLAHSCSKNLSVVCTVSTGSWPVDGSPPDAWVVGSEPLVAYEFDSKPRDNKRSGLNADRLAHRAPASNGLPENRCPFAAREHSGYLVVRQRVLETWIRARAPTIHARGEGPTRWDQDGRQTRTFFAQLP
jgi:hypothetical protein